MNPFSYPNLGASAFILVLGLFVGLQTRGRWDNRILSFVAFCMVTFVWQLTYGIAYNMAEEKAALAFMRIGYSAVIFMPVTFLHFAASFLRKGQMQVVIRVCYVLSFFFLATLFIDGLFMRGAYRYFFGFYPKPFVPVHIAFLALVIFSVPWSVFMLYREWRRIQADGQSREASEIPRIKLVCVAYLIMSIVCLDFLPNYGFGFYPIGFVFVILYSLVIAYTILRYNLHDIQVIVKRTLVFAGLVASVVAVVSLVAFVSQDLLPTAVPKWLSNLSSATFIALLYGPLRRWLTNVTDKYLFQKEYDYKQLLRNFTDEVMVVLDLKQLVQMTIETLSERGKLESCGLLLLDKDTRRYELVAFRGEDGHNVVLDGQEPFVTFLRETHEPIGLDGEMGKVHFPEQVTNRMKQLSARLCLPLNVHEELIGVLCLGKKKSDEEFTKDDLDILQPLARTLAIAVSNAQLVEELKVTQAQAAQKEKLAVIGTLSAGINHEICNPLGIVKAQCEAFLLDVEDGILIGKSSPDVLERTTTIMRVALKQIDRATAITQKLSNFAKPIKDISAQPVSVPQEVDEVLLLVGHDLQLEKIEVVKEMQADMPQIVVDRRQFQEVLFNLVRNAGQAIKPPGTISVRAHVTAEGLVRIEIADTGSGIPADKLEKIYDPFYTTKEPGKGTGLGLFIVRQIVERNKGRISLESTIGKGTTFFLDFPAAKPEAAGKAVTA